MLGKTGQYRGKAATVVTPVDKDGKMRIAVLTDGNASPHFETIGVLDLLPAGDQNTHPEPAKVAPPVAVPAEPVKE